MSTIVKNMGVGGPTTILWPGPANYSGHSFMCAMMALDCNCRGLLAVTGARET